MFAEETSKAVADPWYGTVIVGLVSSLPGLILFWLERRKRRVNTAKEEFDYIKVSQEEILNVYEQVKVVNREFIKLEASLLKTERALQDCEDHKRNCQETNKKTLQIVKDVRGTLRKITHPELTTVLEKLEELSEHDE